jgi:hypothetical protein
MLRLRGSRLVVGALALVASLAARTDVHTGGQPPDAARAAAPALRLLVVTGGHDYPTSFYTLFEGWPDWSWSHAVSSVEAFAKPIVSRFDVLVLYDMSRDLDEPGRTHLRQFVDGGKGVVVLHHAIVSYPRWPWWEEVTGARYFEDAEDGWKRSSYRHDVELVVKPAGRHPVVDPIGPMRLVDETYKGMRFSSRITPLLEIDHPDGDRYVAWVSPYPGSRVVTIQLGHGEPAHRHPAYRALVRNAVVWSAGRLP